MGHLKTMQDIKLLPVLGFKEKFMYVLCIAVKGKEIYVRTFERVNEIVRVNNNLAYSPIIYFLLLILFSPRNLSRQMEGIFFCLGR